jgi:hypothetical protein
VVMNNSTTSISNVAVLYTHDMEPITVIRMNDFLRTHIDKHGCVSVMAYAPITHTSINDCLPRTLPRVKIVAEKVVLRGKQHYILFAENDIDALLLKPEFLAGQQREINGQKKEAFLGGIIHALKNFRGIDREF